MARKIAVWGLWMCGCGVAAQGQTWTPPTAAELAMTSQAEVPGAAAVYLYREQTTEDALRMYSYYVRLKVLTEAGKDYANVELPFGGGAGTQIDSIAGRTIHADGTVVPFTGKAYEKTIVRANGVSMSAKVFTLPAVEVGSVLEYRYKMRYEYAFYLNPDWYVQSELWTRKAHYLWVPTSSTVVSEEDDGRVLSTIAWTPILPAGVKVKEEAIKSRSIATGREEGHVNLTLDVADVPPLPREERMPPVNSLSYRVLFYYTSYHTAAEFWKGEGERWSRAREKFMGGGSGAVGSAVSGLVGTGDSQTVKLRKIYAAVMGMENTDFTRGRSAREDKAEGFGGTASAGEILERKRGSGDELAELFVAMARSAGMKAYVMGVTDRSRRIFLASYLSVRQLDDLIAIVNVDGREMYFDPGQRYCTFGQMAWKHTLSGGLRQTEGGVEVVSSPGAAAYENRTGETADLTLDGAGEATGEVVWTLTGNAALRWRHVGLTGDEESLRVGLRDALRRELPAGMEVAASGVENAADGEKPLVVRFAVKGPVGVVTGRRVLVPASLFEARDAPMFLEAKRDLAVDMHSPSIVEDRVTLTMPTGWTVESVPTIGPVAYKPSASLEETVTSAGNVVTATRTLTVGKTFYSPGEYGELRGFYGKVAAAERETVVLNRGGS